MNIQYTFDQTPETLALGYGYGVGHIIVTIPEGEEVLAINVPVALTSYNFCTRVNLDSPPQFAISFYDVASFSVGNYGGLSVDSFNLGDNLQLVNGQSALISIHRNDDSPITQGVYDFPYRLDTQEMHESQAVYQQNWILNFNGNTAFNQNPPRPNCESILSQDIIGFTPTQYLGVMIPVGLGLLATFISLRYAITYLKMFGK